MERVVGKGVVVVEIWVRVLRIIFEAHVREKAKRRLRLRRVS